MNKKTWLIAGLVVLVIVLGTAAALYFGGVWGPKRKPATITLAQYEQVAREMTQAEVTQILGKGTLDSQTGKAGSPDTVAIYTWAGKVPGSRATVVFHGKVVASLAQVGLQ